MKTVFKTNSHSTFKTACKTGFRTTFIVPKNDDRTYSLHGAANNGRIFPPLGLARMAGLMGVQSRVALVDERVAGSGHKGNTDVAVFFINNYNRQRCLELARFYRENGSHIVFTGPMLNGDLAEVLNYADSLLLGFGEDCIAEFLEDYRQGRAKQYYHGGRKEHPPFKTTHGYVNHGYATQGNATQSNATLSLA